MRVGEKIKPPFGKYKWFINKNNKKNSGESFVWIIKNSSYECVVEINV